MEINFQTLLPNVAWVNKCRAAHKAGGDLALAEVGLEHLDQLEYKPTPVEPDILRQFREDKTSEDWRRKPASEKEMVEKKIFSREDVKTFLDKHQNISVANYAHAVWMEDDMKLFIQSGRPELARKIWPVYSKYPDSIRIGGLVLWRKKKNFGAHAAEDNRGGYDE